MTEALAQLVVAMPPEPLSWGGKTETGMDLVQSEGMSVGMPVGAIAGGLEVGVVPLP